MKCVNIGCGLSPTDGWSNYDNSMSLILSKSPIIIISFIKLIGLLNEKQLEAMVFYAESSVKYADACKHIPEHDHTVDALYSCHMLEHFDVREASLFLTEARRVLKHNGVIRLAVPDLKFYIGEYMQRGDAERFMHDTYLSRISVKNIAQKIQYLIVGDREHKHMYDGSSLCLLLKSSGFKDVTVVPEGVTNIYEPGFLNLYERSSDSVYVEAINP